jgi:hypothetical protein
MTAGMRRLYNCLSSHLRARAASGFRSLLNLFNDLFPVHTAACGGRSENQKRAVSRAEQHAKSLGRARGSPVSNPGVLVSIVRYRDAWHADVPAVAAVPRHKYDPALPVVGEDEDRGKACGRLLTRSGMRSGTLGSTRYSMRSKAMFSTCGKSQGAASCDGKSGSS